MSVFLNKDESDLIRTIFNKCLGLKEIYGLSYAVEPLNCC